VEIQREIATAWLTWLRETEEALRQMRHAADHEDSTVNQAVRFPLDFHLVCQYFSFVWMRVSRSDQASAVLSLQNRCRQYARRQSPAKWMFASPKHTVRRNVFGGTVSAAASASDGVPQHIAATWSSGVEPVKILGILRQRRRALCRSLFAARSCLPEVSIDQIVSCVQLVPGALYFWAAASEARLDSIDSCKDPAE